VVLGTDGYGAGMLAEARVAGLVQREAPRLGDGGVVREALLVGSADLAASYLPRVGHLAPGSPADVVVTSYRPPTPLTGENAWAHLLCGDLEPHVRHVFVGGELVVEAGRNRRLDEAELESHCRERAALLWERFAARSRTGGAA
jgi:cytosine/adenosine deaminase-related metal-dependent hydrolase